MTADIEHDAALGLGNGGQRSIELRAAVAAAGAENIAGEALGVDSDQDILPVADLAADEGDVLDAVEDAVVADRTEIAVRVGMRASATRWT